MNTVQLPRRRELALAICVSVGLTACGGGGGGSGIRSSNIPGGSVPSNNLPSDANTNFNIPKTPSTGASIKQPPVDVQIVATNVKPAHDAGFTGKGVTIGIADSGINANNPALAGRVGPQFNYVDPAANNLAVGDVLGHGTFVAEVAAGRPVGNFVGGVAPDANLVSARIIADKEPKDDGSGKGNKVTSSDPLGDVNDKLRAAGATIINNSWGGIYWDETDKDTSDTFGDAYLAARFGYSLFVFAAGNEGKSDPSTIAKLPSLVSNLEQGWLTVVALDSDNTSQIASYSNRCGVAKNYCLAAPGTIIVTAPDATADKISHVYGAGTSFAAPQVSGAAAVVAQAFPGLSLNGVRTVLLGTADDLGDPGPDAVYGYGRLNVGRAIRGPAKLDWGLFEASFYGRNGEFANDISGAGGLSVYGDSKLTLSGTNTYTGLTSVSSSLTLETMHGIPGALSVGSSARAIVHGDIGGDTSVSSILQTTETSTHITGNYLQTPTGRLSQLLGAPLIVSGTAQLAGNFYVAGAIPGYVPTTHQQVLTAQSISGKFTSTTLAAGVFLNATLQYLPSEVWIDTSTLSVTQVASNSMSQSAAAQSSAQRLDGAFQQIERSLADPTNNGSSFATGTLLAAGGIQQSADTKVAQASLESLSGQLYAASTAVTLAGIEAGNDALIGHLDKDGAGGAWMQSLNGQGGLSRSGFGSVGFNLAGGLAGNDIRIGANGFAGVAFAQMQSNGQLSGNFDRQRSRSTESMLYAGSRGANWYGVGRLGFGTFRGTTQRLLRFGDQASFAGGDNTGHYNAAYGEVGYRTTAGAFSLTPFANVEYASIRRDGFQELGGQGFGLSANGQTTSRWQAGFGLRAGASWLTNVGKLHLDAKLGWQNAFATKGEVFSARYNGIAQWAPVDGIGLSRRAGVAGMTLGWDMSERTQIGVDVDQRFADRDHSRSASATFRMTW
ncbi:autotransporter-associated beta strand repeat-containing protein [Luteibacter sp. UNCMF331Sha3.1]|uniref:S8 family serine peptidase n=1 Tax=Luteibacter sp. UNCMF331Sha3.1 TaxID=1502760 RepID=UPI0008B86F3B|nr:S8 family serine peptidase [Luteibacter sp. UNCMF331Sha3.1]SEM23583.1 autotransporter-associated beta strand repeat-containing protein [Luteibacter sp. UNCMF331Sha3.1]